MQFVIPLKELPIQVREKIAIDRFNREHETKSVTVDFDEAVRLEIISVFLDIAKHAREVAARAGKS